MEPQKQSDPKLEPQIRRQKLRDRLERISTGILGGMMANQAWHSPTAKKYLEAKNLTLERLATQSALELSIEVDNLVIEIENVKDEQPKPTLVTE